MKPKLEWNIAGGDDKYTRWDAYVNPNLVIQIHKWEDDDFYRYQIISPWLREELNGLVYDALEEVQAFVELRALGCLKALEKEIHRVMEALT